MIAYLSSPIDLAGPSPHSARIAEQIRGLLPPIGVGVYVPGNAFWLPDSPTRQPGVHQVNIAALSKCGMLIAVWLSGQQSVGVPLELNYVAESDPFIRIPSLLIHDGWFHKSWSATSAWPSVRETVAEPGSIKSAVLDLVKAARLHRD